MKMASELIQQRLKKDWQMTVISIRIPQDVIEDLKEIAPSLGFSGYQPLIRAYVGQGLRKDQARMGTRRFRCSPRVCANAGSLIM